MGTVRKAAAVIMGVAASLAFAAPAQAAPESRFLPAHYSCGQKRPPNLDGSAIVTAVGATALYRGSDQGSCGLSGVVIGGDRLDYYCWTLGNDGHTYTYLSNLTRGVAGWAWDTQVPNNGSLAHCPI